MAYFPKTKRVGFGYTILMELWCQLDFNKYPMDNQNCSYTLSTRDVAFAWKETGTKKLTSKPNPKGLNFRGQNLDYVPSLSLQNSIPVKNVLGHKTSSVHMSIALQRKSMRYVKQTIMPSAVLVMMSWVGIKSI